MIGIANSGTQIVQPGLIVSLDAAQLRSYPTSGSNWNDLTPSGSNFSLVNGPTFDSANGGNITFDGADDYATIPFTDILYDCTIELWFKATTTAQYQQLFSFQNPANNIFNLNFDMNDPEDPGVTPPSAWNAGNMWVFWNGIGPLQSVIGSTNPGRQSDYVDNTWRHYVFTRGVATTTNHYMNGQLVTANVTRVGDQTIQFGNGAGYVMRLAVGYFSGSPVSFAGKQGIFRVYNRELSAAEILQNYNADKTRYGHS